MTRRGFIRSLAATAVAVMLTRKLPGIAGAVPEIVKQPESVEFKVGDIITIEGHYARSPITNALTEHMQKFMVTAVSESGVSLYPNPELTKITVQ